MTIDVSTLEAFFSAQLGVPLTVSVAKTVCQPSNLSRNEQARLTHIAHPRSKTAYLLGRQALKQLHQPPMPWDTTELTFPHPYLSLSHSVLADTPEAGLAIAVIGPNHLRGLGVDVHQLPGPALKTARRFLTSGEQDFLATQSPEAQPQTLLRLWTVKEALYKADLTNTNTVSTHHYAAFQLNTPDVETGGLAIQATATGKATYRYATACVAAEYCMYCTVAIAT